MNLYILYHDMFDIHDDNDSYSVDDDHHHKRYYDYHDDDDLDADHYDFVIIRLINKESIVTINGIYT